MLARRVDRGRGAQQGHGAVRRWRSRPGRRLVDCSSAIVGGETRSGPTMGSKYQWLSGHGRGRRAESLLALAQPGTEEAAARKVSGSAAPARCTARDGARTPGRGTAGRVSAEPAVATADETATREPTCPCSHWVARRNAAVTDRERWRGRWTARPWRTTRGWRCAAVRRRFGCSQAGLQQPGAAGSDGVRTPRHAAGTCKTTANSSASGT